MLAASESRPAGIPVATKQCPYCNMGQDEDIEHLFTQGGTSAEPTRGAGAEVVYYCACVELFSKMCSGQNDEAAALLVAHADALGIDFESLFTITSSTHVPCTTQIASRVSA